LNPFELISLLLSACLLGGYYMWLAIEVRLRPMHTVISYSTLKRREWVRSIISGRRDILAVQTLAAACVRLRYGAYPMNQSRLQFCIFRRYRESCRLDPSMWRTLRLSGWAFRHSSW